MLALAQAPLVLFSETGDGRPARRRSGATLALLVLLFWSIVVQAHIAARALSSNFGVGLAVALVYFLLNYQVSGQFAPAAG